MSNRNANWVLGEQLGISFIQEQPTFFKTKSSGKHNEGNACISDENGNLLFYLSPFNPLKPFFNVYNKENTIVLNGGNLNFEGTMANGLLILPYRKDSLQEDFILLSLIDDFILTIFRHHLILKKDSSMEVNVRNKRVSGYNLKDSIEEKIVPVKNAKSDQWYIITKSNELINNYFKVYQTDARDTLKFLRNQNLEPFLNKMGVMEIGDFAVTLAGDRIAWINSFPGRLYLYDFDRCTGKLSNPIKLCDTLGSYYGGLLETAYGCAFSPDGTKLYLSDYTNLYHIDLITHKFNKLIENPSTDFGTFSLLELAPNGKIYFANHRSNRDGHIFDSLSNRIGVIDNPNGTELTCGVKFIKLPDGMHTTNGLPNNPYYDMPPLLFPEVARAGRYADTLFVCPKDSVKLGTFYRENVKYKWTSTLAGLAGIKDDTLAAPWFQPGVGIKTTGDTLSFVLTCTGLGASCWAGEVASDTVVVVVRAEGDTVDCKTTDRPHPQPLSNLERGVKVRVYPNPTSNFFTLSYTSSKEGDAEGELIDVLGRKVWSKKYEVKEGKNEFIIAPTLSPGMYFLRWKTSDGIVSLKVVKN